MSEEDSRPEAGRLPESPLSPADDERIRRLLAEARHTGPMPEPVADRLGQVLARLSIERTEREAMSSAPVVELAARRRRTVANLLVAAAAVLVVGFGITQVLPDVGARHDSPTAADQAEAGGAGGNADGDYGAGSRNAQPETSPEAPSADSAWADPVRIRSDHFGADVRKVRRELDLGEAPAPLEQPAKGGCPVGPVGDGTPLAASYDGAPATLVLRPPAGDVQVADVYLCGETVARQSITLTAR
jgi:hypothetical protein